MTSDECFFKDKVLISKDVDTIFEQIVDYVLRDYFYSWAVDFVPNDETFKDLLSVKIKNEIWLVLRRLISRIQDIEAVTFLTETLPRILQRHFEKFNLASSQQIDENQHLIRFMVARHLEDDRAELEFLRKICEYLLRILLPNYICDPYFLNHQAIIYGAIVGPVATLLDIQTFPENFELDQQVLQQLPTDSATSRSDINQKPEVKHIDKHINKTKAKIDEFRHKLNQRIIELQSSSNIPLNASSLNQEFEQLRAEVHDLECHLTRAELWRYNMGAWLIEVHCVERWTETEEMLVLFLVYTDKSKTSNPSRASSTGWVTIRSLAEVCDQKRRLSKKIPALRKLDHPIFRRNDKGHSTTPQSIWKKELQQFFDLLIRSEQLADNEEVFIFLSPTPKNIVAKISNVPSVTSKLSKLPFLPYFGVSPILLNSANQKAGMSKPRNSTSLQSASDFNFQQSPQNSYNSQSYYSGFNFATNHQNSPGSFLNDEEESKEGISESVYDLVSEIFELKKAQNWLRRTIVLFFQVAFGKTINKQIKDTVSQITDESFIARHLIKFRDSFWPNGVLAEPSAKISEDDKKLTYLLAKQYLINNIPDVFNNLIGQQNARKGFLKVFEALQNKKANKQLFYDILEAFLLELSPELKSK